MIALDDVNDVSVEYGSVGCVAVGFRFRVEGFPHIAMRCWFTWDFRAHRPTKPAIDFHPFDTELARKGGLLDTALRKGVELLLTVLTERRDELNAEWNDGETSALARWSKVGCTVDNSWLCVMRQPDPASKALSSLGKWDAPWKRTVLEHAREDDVGMTATLIAHQYVQLRNEGETSVVKVLAQKLGISTRSVRDLLLRAEQLGLLTQQEAIGVASRRATSRLAPAARLAVSQFAAVQNQGPHVPTIECMWRVHALADLDSGFPELLKHHAFFPQYKGLHAEDLVRQAIRYLRDSGELDLA